MSRAMILALALAACSPAPVENEAVATASKAEPVAAPASPAPAQPTPAQVDPVPGKPRVFGDWVVGCDNTLLCKAVSLAPVIEARPDYMIAIERDAGPGGEVRIHFDGEGDAVPPIAITVDGKQIVRGGDAGDVPFRGPIAARIASAIAAGSEATVESGGKPGKLWLGGASAALRYIDAEQGRAGTTGALVARGPAADNAPQPALPIVRAAAASGTAATLTPAMLVSMRAAAQCNEDGNLPFGDPETHPLGSGKTLAIIPCGMGAYQGWSAIFIVEDGRATAAPFDVDMYSGDVPIPSLTNNSFEKGVLSGYAKGRGLGDCGFGQDFVWDGKRFRLIDQREMTECRGSLELISTWRAKVER